MKWKDKMRYAAVLLSFCMLFEHVSAGAAEFSLNPEQTDMTEFPGIPVRTSSNAWKNVKTNSNAVYQVRSNVTGDLWKDWTGDMSFLSGDVGKGTEEEPYQISTKAQLMGFSELAARGMTIQAGQGTYVGDYSDSYFKLTRDIDLQGMDWIPIGFCQNEAELISGEIKNTFSAHFDGGGHAIKNFRMYQPDWENAGLFGAVRGGEIRNLTVDPGNVITAKDYVGILAGCLEDCIVKDVTVTGRIQTYGNAGGIAGAAIDSLIENAAADHVSIDSQKGDENCVGGIAGKAEKTMIADCVVSTGDSTSARLQGEGYIGGITGLQNDSDLFNVTVSGTIGGAGTAASGGFVGKYVAGKLQVGRFSGKIASSGLGSRSHEGTFIGTRDSAHHFTYGPDGDLAYLFADTENKILADVCGSGVPEDNVYTYDAHIGYWHEDSPHFTLISAGKNKKSETYFYEELEDGILNILDTGSNREECSLDHYAPDANGRPVRGYLLSVNQIDTAAGGDYFYDVAVLNAIGPSQYDREISKERRGAIRAGAVVTVTTAPKNTDTEKFQMDGVPFYTVDGQHKEAVYQTGGRYTFSMPESDTELSAIYKKVAAAITVKPEEFTFEVVQTRTGNRKEPEIETAVWDESGKLLASYKGNETSSSQPIYIAAVVDANNDVEDSRVKWEIDDMDLIRLMTNDDTDSEGYTAKSASIELNIKAGFFQEIIEKLEKEQAEFGCQYRIPDTIFGAGHETGGRAVLTAKTRPSASFEGKPLTGTCQIHVTFQIKDQTQVAAEETVLDKNSLTYTVTRKLDGDRTKPTETLTVSGPQTLTANFSPDYFDKKDVTWTSSDGNIVQVEGGNEAGDYKNALVYAVKDAQWIQNIVEADQGIHESDPYRKWKGAGKRTATITVVAVDTLGNRQTADCHVTVNFVTDDQTEIFPENITIQKSQLELPLKYVKSGDIQSDTVRTEGFDGAALTAVLSPVLAKESDYEPYNRNIQWSVSEDGVVIIEDGKVIPVDGASWIQEALEKPPYRAEKTIFVTAVSEKKPELKAVCEISLTFEAECLEIQESPVKFELLLTKTGKRSNPTLAWSGEEGKRLTAATYPESDTENRIAWSTDSDVLRVDAEGNVAPYLDGKWIQEAMKKYPYTAEKTVNVWAAMDGKKDSLPVTVTFKLIDKTYSSSSGGSGGGSSSSSSYGSAAHGAANTAADSLYGDNAGTWIQEEGGSWKFINGDHTYTDEWAYVYNPYAGEEQSSTDWFRFGADGYMKTGWHQDSETGYWFYLHNISDGTLGHMYTGWNMIDGKWYYFNPISDGTRGKMASGWNWIDGKCYYLDPKDGYLYVDTVTPDGFAVDETGCWIPETEGPSD